MKYFPYFIPLLIPLSAVIVYGFIPDKTPQHTSTVSGSSGDLICTTSCIIKEND